MVTIKNGDNIHVVTEGAYKEIFSRLGYEIISGKEEVSIETPIDMDDNTMSEEEMNFILGVEEKPISQWSKAEVKKYAELKRIDITGTKNVNEAKAIIKEFLG
jgi:hypothetical protein